MFLSGLGNLTLPFRTFAKSLFPERFKEAVKDSLGVPSVSRSLRLLRTNGFHPRVVLDIGAYKGEWAALCNRIWPETTILMIEANPERAQALQALAAQWQRVTAERWLLGSSEREGVPFYEQESASSVLPEAAKQEQLSVQLSMHTLDGITQGTKFRQPDLIKLDVQGYELEILKGGRETLRSAEAVLMEVNFLPIYRGAPLLQEAVDFLGDAGFRAYDVSGLIRRPLDGALWQGDVVFVRNSSALLSSDRYQ